jgi:hypothetical protein
MRRIKFVFAALAIVVTSLAAFAGPSMADDLNCRDARGNLIRCDGRLYEPSNNRFYNDYNPYAFYNDYNPYAFYNHYNDYYGYGFDDEIPVWTGYGWCEYDLEDNEYDC